MEPMSKVAASEDGVKIGVTAALSSMAGILNFSQKFKKANQVRERDDKPGRAEWIGKNNWLNNSHKTHSTVSFANNKRGEDAVPVRYHRLDWLADGSVLLSSSSSRRASTK
jgi:hypothetical protein